MDEIEALAERIDNDDADTVRLAIADLIGRLITERRYALGYWEKQWFAQAIASLAWNIRREPQDSTAWLRLCLAALQNALAPAERRSENYAPQIAAIDALTADQLLADVRTLGGAV
jgi:hypothetical protein